ncbi:tyrosine-type recombinase/integrase [Thermodesulfobacteriota bacterium]
MSPKKRTKNVNWPEYVTESNGRIVYRPRIPKKLQSKIDTDKYGYLRPPVRLGKIGDPTDQVIRAYLAAKSVLDFKKEPDKNTLSYLSTEYQSSKRLLKLAPTTQRKYGQLLEQILNHPIKINKDPAILGDLKPDQLTKPMLRKIVDNRLDMYRETGKKGEVQVNRQFAVLSSMLTWAIQYVEDLNIIHNPCFGIERIKEHAKSRYVTDEEYQTQYKIAAQVADYLPVFFEHAYLLASRGIEVRSLKLSDITEDGYKVHRRKGSKDNIINWSPRLHAAHHEALKLKSKRKMGSIYLIPSTTGRMLTQNTLQAAMQRLKKKMKEKGLEKIYWTVHDLKRKGISDAKDKGIGGHKSEAMKARYATKIESFEPPE